MLARLFAASDERSCASLAWSSWRCLPRLAAARFDFVFRSMSALCAVGVFVTLSAVLIVLAIAAWPAFQAFGPKFFVADVWNPVTDSFGALSSVFGTVVTAFLAMAIAVPIAYGIAFFLTQLAPAWLARPVAIAVELLAGIPSIIYGMWGLLALAPFVRHSLQPTLESFLGPIPVIGSLFRGPCYGVGIMTASWILAIMVLPYVATFLREIFETVPDMLKESAYALGATTWDVMSQVIMPYVRVAAMGGVVLGLGRALGETMAVTFVVGNAHRISPSLFAPGTTISSTIANEFNEATGALYTSSLLALGLILFVITFLVLAAGRLLVRMLDKDRTGMRGR
ncbi:MAG: phosphate ABC transporter permease subunit PstC [Bdellovibrionales bacterium]